MRGLNLNKRTQRTFALLILIPLLAGTLEGCATAAAVVAGTAATGVILAQDRRTTGTIVDDKGIELKATQSIRQKLGEEEKKTHVSVISYNNRVLLVGQAPTKDVKAEVEQAIRQVARVKQLHNEIELAAPISMLTRSSDSLITTKIKSAMLIHRELNPSRIKVVTEDGIVYLLGIVTPAEEEIAVEMARHTKGVKKVVKIFEYAAK